MTDKTSLVQARYALSVLKIAQSSDVNTAVRLIENLARDIPLNDVTAGMAELHWSAIATYVKLVESLRSGPRNSVPPWGAAIVATSSWLDMAS